MTSLQTQSHANSCQNYNQDTEQLLLKEEKVRQSPRVSVATLVLRETHICTRIGV